MARNRNYVDGPAVTKALNEFYYQRKEALENGLPEPHLPKIVGESILAIAKNYSSSGKFSRVPNKADMISSGVLSAMENVARKYDPEKSQTKNAFSFLTSLVYWGFLGYFQSEKHVLREKNAYIEALTNGHATISGETVHSSNTSLKQLQKTIDQYKLDNI
ncbi:sigma factor for late transcription protein [Rhizobium phage RHph_Y68]|uniref:Sigma factor for late transcription protein n=1 Tax=Rhizobium phage RHph_Y68 TaxID=2509787 RepID=A0A7S5R989_9CAUD|nr:late sigma transcription factor [Rhizobium phage RHph_Y68]QIG68089.1 sigma factor for late transcription protein [Rhizobium phage RHph_Y68]